MNGLVVVMMKSPPDGTADFGRVGPAMRGATPARAAAKMANPQPL